ncbi:putative N-acetyltransferase ycf52-like protein [Podospora aff. communis PSN243]|uniref:N-acetyltransferase ycf52-like protein n=1 Tax=Podospora aff. communis PSN243 TaxID=3040156 RepID=A0AAV9H2C8_9PEZI|nr:putative N-acetyltransferase ycf52-like protein [Podospora aff. communis PSN243]
MNKTLRIATVADLDAMTWVLVGASPMDPIYPYRFPDRNLYTDEFAELCRQKCAEYLATSTVVVCEMPIDQNPSRTQVVAFSVWDAPHIPTPLQLGREPLSRPTNNPVLPITIGHRDRMNVFREKCAANKRDFFDSRYTRGHMFLKILLCHPDYQRRGAGCALTTWGIQEGRRLGLNTTVFASPMGLNLYRKLGFREIGRFRVQLEGDEDFLEIPALVLPPDDGCSRRVMGDMGMPLPVAVC